MKLTKLNKINKIKKDLTKFSRTIAPSFISLCVYFFGQSTGRLPNWFNTHTSHEMSFFIFKPVHPLCDWSFLIWYKNIKTPNKAPSFYALHLLRIHLFSFLSFHRRDHHHHLLQLLHFHFFCPYSFPFCFSKHATREAYRTVLLKTIPEGHAMPVWILMSGTKRYGRIPMIGLGIPRRLMC